MNTVPRSRPFADVVTELLSRGYRVRFRAKGASMHPTIRGGETITVEPVSPVHIGDIALYRAERGLIVHRVVAIRTTNGTASVFLTRGDARHSTEEAVHEQQVLGKVLGVERNGRSIDLGSRWAKTCRRVRSVPRLARDWGATLVSAHGARVLLLVSVLAVMFPEAARAAIGITGRVSASFSSGNICNLPGLNTIGATLILFSVSGTNANTFNPGTTITLTPAGGTVTLIPGANATGSNASVGIYQITGFTQTISLTVTGNNFTSGAAGFVCGAIAFSGVSSVGTPWTITTGTSTSASITGANPGPGGVVFDTLSVATGTPTAIPDVTQVQQWNAPSGAGGRLGAASLAGPTTTMSWTLSASQFWRMAAVPLNPSSITEVRPTAFTVTQHADRNLIELTTRREVSSLGFNLYREQNGERVRLNSSLLAGTALLAGSQTQLTVGHVHTWWDAPSGDASSASYWVEEVDLHGQRTWLGPATPKATAPDRPRASGGATALLTGNASTTALVKDAGGRVMLLSQVGRAAAAPGTGVDSASHPLQPRAVPATTISHPTTISSQKMRAPYATTTSPSSLAAGPAVKIGVQSEGWYQVAWSNLIAAGLDPNADVTTLQLYAEGVLQPILVQPQDNIQFYGTGLDTTWSDTRVYWLTWGNEGGRRVQTETLQQSDTAGPSSFPFAVEWKPRTVYFAALVNGDADNFFGPVLTSAEPVSQAITLTNLDPNATDGAQLQVTLQGVSMAPHSVGVALNGTQVGTVTFSNQTKGVATLSVPQSGLQEGQNQLTLTVNGGDGDISVVDNVELTYDHSYTTDSDSLRFTALGGQAATIGGFSNAQILVADISNPESVTLVPGTITQEQDGSYSVTIVPQASGTRTLLALTSAQEAQAASITSHHPSTWGAAQTGFDMVMISHGDFMDSLAPLVSLHQAEGRNVAVIDVADLYDEFSFGEKSPYALKNFLSTAQAQWQLKPRFVLLMGDATYDPRNYLGVGDFDFVPTYLVGTQFLETASDDWFADFSGQGIPQMAIGRLPVRTAQDADAQVSKIVNYNQSGTAGWQTQVLLVVGQNDSENDFAGDAAAVQALLPGDLTVSQISESSPTANTDLLNSLNQGQGLVNFIGHGSEAVWTGGLFSSTDASGLTNGSMVPFVVSMTCLNGYFQDVYETALAKALIEAPGGGALAVWASSGLTESAPQTAMNQALITALFGTQPMTLGEAAAAAKTAISDLDVRRTWILFGDPAIRLQR